MIDPLIGRVISFGLAMSLLSAAPAGKRLVAHRVYVRKLLLGAHGSAWLVRSAS